MFGFKKKLSTKVYYQNDTTLEALGVKLNSFPSLIVTTINFKKPISAKLQGKKFDVTKIDVSTTLRGFYLGSGELGETLIFDRSPENQLSDTENNGTLEIEGRNFVYLHYWPETKIKKVYKQIKEVFEKHEEICLEILKLGN